MNASSTGSGWRKPWPGAADVAPAKPGATPPAKSAAHRGRNHPEESSRTATGTVSPARTLGRKIRRDLAREIAIGKFWRRSAEGRTMLSIHENRTLEEASSDLLAFILDPSNWVMLEELRQHPNQRPGENADYQRRVGALRICASVDVTPRLDAFLRIAFRGPGLTPTRAADHLAAFLGERIPLTPNSEWQGPGGEGGGGGFLGRCPPPPAEACERSGVAGG